MRFGRSLSQERPQECVGISVFETHRKIRAGFLARWIPTGWWCGSYGEAVTYPATIFIGWLGIWSL